MNVLWLLILVITFFIFTFKNNEIMKVAFSFSFCLNFSAFYRGMLGELINIRILDMFKLQTKYFNAVTVQPKSAVREKYICSTKLMLLGRDSYS